jgi:hypothetical protein
MFFEWSKITLSFRTKNDFRTKSDFHIILLKSLYFLFNSLKMILFKWNILQQSEILRFKYYSNDKNMKI